MLALGAAVFVALSSLFSGDYYDARLAFLFAAMAAAAAVTPAVRPPVAAAPVDGAPVTGAPAPPMGTPAAEPERARR
jgi:hypothetical protein